MTKACKSVGIMATWLLCFMAIGCQPVFKDRDTGYRADLDYFSRELPKRHPDFFHQLDKGKFEKAVEKLDENIPQLSDAEVIVGFAELVAMSDDSHTSLSPLQRYRDFFPIICFWFEDGLRVAKTDKKYTDLIGARLVAIDGMPIESVIERVEKIFPAENEAVRMQSLPRYIMSGDILHALRITRSAEQAKFELEMEGGGRVTHELPVLPVGSMLFTEGRPEGKKLPLERRHDDKNFWSIYLPEYRTVYLKYRRCKQSWKVPFDPFARKTMKQAKERGAEKLVIDLRQNGGGNSGIADPFIRRLKSHPTFSRPGGLFVLIGRRTYSSAILNAIKLKKECGAVLVGEPTGGVPNHFGEVKTMTLPYSGLTLRHSTRFFSPMPEEKGKTLRPDIVVMPTWESFSEGNDLALRACLDYGNTQ
ncbi:MAG: S41 family peptidase [Phycisphaerae bacterium]